MKPDQERVKNLLADTVTLLCKNGLTFDTELRVEGLIGITVDESDVFLVHLNEKYVGECAQKPENSDTAITETVGPPKSARIQPSSPSLEASSQRHLGHHGHGTPNTSRRTAQKRHQVNDGSSVSDSEQARSSPLDIKIKIEDDDDLLIVESNNVRQPDASDRLIGSRQHDVEVMRQGYHSTENVSFDEYKQTGQSPVKRRRHSSELAGGGNESHDGSSSGDGAYITGLVRNVHDGESSNASWTGMSTGLTAEIASQVIHSGATGEVQQPGCSSWSQGSPYEQATHQSTDMLNVRWTKRERDEVFIWPKDACGPPDRPRRPTQSRDKQWRCDFPGCDRSFYHQRDLNRHKKLKEHI